MYKTEANKRIEAESALCLFCHNDPSKAEFIYKTDTAGTVCGAVYRIHDLASVLHNLKAIFVFLQYDFADRFYLQLFYQRKIRNAM